MMWNLAISPQQFKEIYGTAVDISVFKREATSDEDFVTHYLASKLWRLNNLYTIVDKDGNRIRFRMNYAQHVVYAASLQHPRLIILKSRQQGISTFWLISFLDDAMVMTDINVGLMAQGKSEASTLLKRTKLAWDEFDDSIKNFLSMRLQRDNTEEVGFSNGATLFIRTSFRSATLQRLHISEYGKIAKATPERAKETKTGTLQAIRPGNTVVIESTAEGDNDFKQMWNQAIAAEKKVQRLGLPAFAGKDFKPVFLSWLNDPDCVSETYEEASLTQEQYFTELGAKTGKVLTQEQRNFWIAQYRELGDAIYQEYPGTAEEAFTKVNDGSYYGTLYQTHVIAKGNHRPNLYDKNLPVHVAMDLGVNDMFVLVYFQVWRGEWRIIDEYMNTGEGLEFYVKHMQDSPYTIDVVICPHDIRVTELGTGKSRLARLRELGVTNIRVLPRLPIIDGIERVRAMIPKLFIDEKCTYINGCFQNYSKEWDDKHGTWKAKPLHDNWSHGADCVRGMALSGLANEEDYDKPATDDPEGDYEVVDGLAF